MFVASHVAAGSLVFDALRDEKRPWLKWPLAIGGFFVSHWILDLTPCYHDLYWPYNAFQWFILFFNLAFVALIWWASRRPKHWWLPPSRVVWGVFGGWLLWDICGDPDLFASYGPLVENEQAGTGVEANRWLFVAKRAET